MANALAGFGTLLALSLPESTYGTEVSRVVSTIVRQTSLHVEVQNAVVDNVSSYLGGPLDAVQTNSKVVGSTTHDLCYSGNGLGILLMAIFGAVAESGSGPYVHTFTMAEAVKSFSAAQLRGNSAKAEEMYGLAAQKSVIKLDARGVCSIETTWVGKNAGSRGSASPSLPALTSRTFVMGHQVGSFTFNSVAYVCKSITITIDNKVEPIEEHGSISPSEVNRNDRAEVTIDLELFKRVETLYSAYLGNTNAAWSFTISDGTNSLAFSGPAAIIQSHDDPIEKNGIVMEKLKLRCMASSGSAGAIQAVLTNGDATYGVS